MIDHLSDSTLVTNTFKESTVISRPRLLARIRDAARFQIILISAPAGFGKSVAIRQILEERSNAISVSITSRTASLTKFVYAFAEACSDVFDDINVPDNVGEAPLNITLDLWTAWALSNLKSRQCSIAVDDLQYAESDPRIAELLISLTKNCGDGVQWIFASRTRRSLPMLNSQAYGKTGPMITADDLRLTTEEAQELAIVLGSKKSPEEINQWVEHTRGFPVPLAFAIRLSARSEDDIDMMDAPRAITFQFLADQLWHSLENDARELLLIVSLVPTSHVHDFERGGIVGAASILSKLADDISFLNLSKNGNLTIHDLFRDFLRQQIFLLGANATDRCFSVAIELLFLAKRYAEGFAVALESANLLTISQAIESHYEFVEGLTLVTELVTATSEIPISRQSTTILSMHATYWMRLGNSEKTTIHAEEILQRAEATTYQIMIAMRAINKFMNVRSRIEHERWSERIASSMQRLDVAHLPRARAYQINLLARYNEFEELVRISMIDIERDSINLDLRERFEIQNAIATSKFCLGERVGAIHANREAVAIARILEDQTGLARALNALGLMLYDSGQPEYELVASELRPIVEKSGGWRYSHSSHWLPLEFVARTGNSASIASATLLQNSVILSDHAETRQFECFRTVCMQLCNLIDGNYNQIIIQQSLKGIEHYADFDDQGNYRLAIILALASAFLGKRLEAEKALVRASSVRKRMESDWEKRSIYDFFYCEIITLVRLGRLTEARSVFRKRLPPLEAYSKIDRSIVLLCDGPPFAGVMQSIEGCIGQPFVGLIALLVRRTVGESEQFKDVSPLTKAETEILNLLALGKSNKEIATVRQRSFETVKRQIAAVYRKLCVENRTHAVAVARDRGLIQTFKN